MKRPPAPNLAVRRHQCQFVNPSSLVHQGLVNVPIEHHPTIGDIISNRYGKVMFKIPKKGHLPTPVHISSYFIIFNQIRFLQISRFQKPCNSRYSLTRKNAFSQVAGIHGNPIAPSPCSGIQPLWTMSLHHYVATSLHHYGTYLAKNATFSHSNLPQSRGRVKCETIGVGSNARRVPYLPTYLPTYLSIHTRTHLSASICLNSWR